MKYYLLNRTNSVQILNFGGSLGTIQLGCYEAKEIDEKDLSLNVQRTVDNTFKQIVLCDEIPKKFKELQKLNKKGLAKKEKVEDEN